MPQRALRVFVFLWVVIGSLTVLPLRAVAQAEHTVSGAFTPARIAVGETTTLTINVAYAFTSISELTASGPPGAALISQTTSCGVAVIGPTLPPGGRSISCSHTLVWRFDSAGSYSADDFAFTYAYLGVPITPAYGDFELPLEVVAPAAPTPTRPAVCPIGPDIAVSPQFIELLPGGEATVEVALRNLCNDSPSAGGDVLISFSDGLTVVGVGDMMLELGPRASAPGIVLQPGETRVLSATVQAQEQLTAPPVHITEYYVGGRVVERIDGVFITPAAPVAVEPTPAADGSVLPAAAAESTVAAEPDAALPISLPNTAGEAAGLLPLLTLLLALAAGGALLRRTA
jgi:hypothetical protein